MPLVRLDFPLSNAQENLVEEGFEVAIRAAGLATRCSLPASSGRSISGWADGALLTIFPGDTTMTTVEQARALAEGGSARIPTLRRP
jgi:hypothetical protein